MFPIPRQLFKYIESQRGNFIINIFISRNPKNNKIVFLEGLCTKCLTQKKVDSLFATQAVSFSTVTLLESILLTYLQTDSQLGIENPLSLKSQFGRGV